MVLLTPTQSPLESSWDISCPSLCLHDIEVVGSSKLGARKMSLCRERDSWRQLHLTTDLLVDQSESESELITYQGWETRSRGTARSWSGRSTTRWWTTRRGWRRRRSTRTSTATRPRTEDARCQCAGVTQTSAMPVLLTSSHPPPPPQSSSWPQSGGR